MQPVLEVLSAADVRQDKTVEAVFTCQSHQGTADTNAQQHKQAREVADSHLKSLRGHTICDQQGAAYTTQTVVVIRCVPLSLAHQTYINMSGCSQLSGLKLRGGIKGFLSNSLCTQYDNGDMVC